MAANQKRIVYFEPWFDPICEEMLRARPDIDLVLLSPEMPQAENFAVFKGTHGFQVGGLAARTPPWRPSDELFARCPSMVAVASQAAGHDHIDVAACTRAGIAVFNQSGSNREAVAEHTLGFMLVLSKHIAHTDRLVRRAERFDRDAHWGDDIYGRTVGIVGIGHIGGRVAELCGALFDMTVLAYDPYLSAEKIQSKGAVKVELPELLRRSDFVTVHCPREADTIGMFGREQFALMKPGAFFINTARGRIHQEGPLAEALAAGRIAGAGIDVFDSEPPGPGHPLLGFDNVIANPHVAGVTEESRRNLCSHNAEQWFTVLAGGVPPGLVNPEVWPAYCERFERILGIRPAPLPD